MYDSLNKTLLLVLFCFLNVIFKFSLYIRQLICQHAPSILNFPNRSKVLCFIRGSGCVSDQCGLVFYLMLHVELKTQPLFKKSEQIHCLLLPKTLTSAVWIFLMKLNDKQHGPKFGASK